MFTTPTLPSLGEVLCCCVRWAERSWAAKGVDAGEVVVPLRARECTFVCLGCTEYIRKFYILF